VYSTNPLSGQTEAVRYDAYGRIIKN